MIGGATVHPIFAPNREQMLQHVMHLFGDQMKGMVEICWTPPETRDVSRARMFDVGDLDSAVDFACKTNAVIGQCVYIGAALRKPGTFPSTRGDDADYYGTTAAYADLDDIGAADIVKPLYEACKPTMVVVTGRHPHTRAQLWWKLEDAFGDPKRHEAMMGGVAAALHGDTTVTNASRPMRLGGSIAWPKKDGRVIEMTSVVIPQDNRPKAVYSDQIAAIFPAVAATASAAPAEGRGAISGKLSTAWLINEIQNGRLWHKNMVKLTGNLVMRGSSDAEILTMAGGLTTAGYTVNDTVKEMRRAVEDGRKSWGRTNPEPEFDDAETPQSKFKFLDLDDIEKLQPPTYAIDGLVTELGFTLIWGKQASYKSFVALDMGLSMAYGLPYHGREVLPKRVLYIAGEGASGFKKRIAAWRKYHDRLGHKGDFQMLATAVNLVSKQAANELVAAINALENPFDYVFVDTVARAMLGAEENDASAMGLFIQACDIIRAQVKCGLTAVHHSGKDSALGPRGSSALPNAVDTDFFLRRDEGSEAVEVTCKKQKDDEEPKPFRFTAQKVTIDGGGIMGQSSLVMTSPVAGAASQAAVKRALTKSEVDGILREIDGAWKEKNPWSLFVQAKREGRYLPMWISRNYPLNAREAQDYIEQLLVNGFLVVDVVDSHSKKKGLRVLKYHDQFAEVAGDNQ